MKWSKNGQKHVGQYGFNRCLANHSHEMVKKTRNHLGQYRMKKHVGQYGMVERMAVNDSHFSWQELQRICNVALMGCDLRVVTVGVGPPDGHLAILDLE